MEIMKNAVKKITMASAEGVTLDVMKFVVDVARNMEDVTVCAADAVESGYNVELRQCEEIWRVDLKREEDDDSLDEAQLRTVAARHPKVRVHVTARHQLAKTAPRVRKARPKKATTPTKKISAALSVVR